jgi:hypothetical protein
MLGPVLYTMVWVLRGFLQPGYSHIRDDVSSLMAVGAPNKSLFDRIHLADVVLMILFFASLSWAMDVGGGLAIGPVCFHASHVLELLVGLFFPLDEGGGIESPRAKMHVALVGLMAFLAMLGMLAMRLQLGSVEGWRLFSQYSLVTFIVTLATGLVAARSAGTAIMGFTERLVVTSTMQYTFVLALWILLVQV